MCYNCWKGNVPSLHDRIATHLMRIDKSLRIIERMNDISAAQVIYLNSSATPSILERAAILEKLKGLHLHMLKRQQRLLAWYDHVLDIEELFAPTGDAGAV